MYENRWKVSTATSLQLSACKPSLPFLSNLAEFQNSAGFFGLFTAGMTSTSFDLVFNNLTQIEKLALKTKVHTLAILKPPTKQLMRINPYMATHLSYSEITYPLENGQILTSIPNHYSEHGPEIAMPPQYQANKSSSPRDPTSDISSYPQGDQPTETPVKISDGVLERLQLAGAQVLTSGFYIKEPVRRPEIMPTGTDESRLLPSSRDRLATRTFAILRLEEGSNPWDLGSRLLNFQSVMGTNLFDYLLPIKRSPCCDHESQESHFPLGPYVDLLKATVYFIEAKDMRFKQDGGISTNIEELENRLGERSKRRRRRKRRSHARREENREPIQDENSPVSMNIVNGRPPPTH